ncbi:MAG: MgtC/SapB family protein [Clostridia bacterium]|nr:MgtC/SapB family protein [Clostridia bacterium]
MEVVIGVFTSFWFQTVLKLVLGFVLAGIIGLERDSMNKPAGFKTHSLLGISAVLIMICGEYLTKNYNADPTRIPAQLLSGIGFIGAGTILRDGFNVKGLTTAAGLLAVTCIGLSIGAGFYFGGIVTTIIVYLILSYSYKLSDKLDHFDVLEFHIQISKDDALKQIEKTLSKYEVDIKQIKRMNKNNDDDIESLIIVGEYNKKIFNKNELIRAISSLKNVEEVVVETNE